MNKFIDSIIATQLSTVIAAALTCCAHMISTGEILNPNWDFAIYLCLGVATLFMAIPYIIHKDVDTALESHMKTHKAMIMRLRKVDPEFADYIKVYPLA